ncbi:uracil-DNA glycosylase [Duganella callida]|uniref:Uracil-DNA glycosylase n=2 Tax=Duganella callida TaxID=2561932 RepID=A0A4Y9SE01_9BURK|nr:uracil-DNA glycosylase [Duganella callida]
MPPEPAPRPAQRPFTAAAAAATVTPVAQPRPSAPALSSVPSMAQPVSQQPSAPRTPASPEQESTAWFDEAPMPVVSTRPPLKTAAPNMNQPARPQPPAARTPAPVEEESTAWFDDAPAPARPAPVSDEAIAVMDWDALKTAVATCTRCALCETRRNAVNGRGAHNAKWIAIGAAPSRLDEKDNQTVAGEAGQLLHNMLKAVELKPEDDVYITSLVKCRPSTPDGADRAPTVDELSACRPYLERELVLTGAAMAMTFGQHAARGLMLGPAARGKVMRYGEAQLPVVATYHPDDLLRKPEDKAKAWADLCLAKAAGHG